MAGEKKARLFIRNPEGEPWAYFGDYADDPKRLKQFIGDFVLAEIEGEFSGITRDGAKLRIEVQLKQMTDAEVEALPDM